MASSSALFLLFFLLIIAGYSSFNQKSINPVNGLESEHVSISNKNFQDLKDIPSRESDGAIAISGNEIVVPASRSLLAYSQGTEDSISNENSVGLKGTVGSESGAVAILGDGGGPARRTLLAHSHSLEHETALAASLDGTIYLLENNSGKVRWSFSSGPSLSSSDDDWNLYYVLNEHLDSGKLLISLEECMSEDQGVTLGSKKTTVFLADAKTREVTHIYRLGDNIKSTIGVQSDLERKILISLDEHFSSIPLISEDGVVTLWSKETTAFLLDARTGKLVHAYQLGENAESTLMEHGDKERKVPVSTEDVSRTYISEDGGFSPGLKKTPVSIVNAKTREVSCTYRPNNKIRSALGKLTDQESPILSDVEDPVKYSPVISDQLHITRTEYSLQSYAPNSPNITWSIKATEIGLTLYDQKFRNGYGGIPFSQSYKPVLEHMGGLMSPSLVQTRNELMTLDKHDKLPKNHQEGQDLPLPLPKSKNSMILHIPNEAQIPLQSSCELRNDCVVGIGEASGQNVDAMFYSVPSGASVSYLKFVGFLLFLLPLIWCILQVMPEAQSNDLGTKQSANSKKRKNRKTSSGKNSIGVNIKQDDYILSENEGQQNSGIVNVQQHDSESLFTLTTAVDGDGRWVGKLFVSKTEIAKGSNGTTVFEGVYDGRRVAVKRLVQAHHDIASKEIQNLIASDLHPNIVRWYGVEHDSDFVYLMLERCSCSLNDLVLANTNSSDSTLNSIKGINKDIELWKANGYPSSQLLKLMGDIVCGLAHLHELGIIHRDLKPQNVLISSGKSLCAKLSDMGISKRLPEGMSSLGTHATGYGSSGWQAPEQLLRGRHQTCAVDLFSLGCILFFCITGGKSPFGEEYFERDTNIVKNNVDLFLVDNIPEAVDLFTRLLNPDPEARPRAMEVLRHPLFWSSEMRLSFFRDTSDWLESEDEDKRKQCDLLESLECVAPLALGGKWDEKLETSFLTNLGRYRRYKFDSTRDLLRVIRNKLNHYRELPKEIQELLGPLPEGFDSYFASRFPQLLIEVYKLVCKYCKEDNHFVKYFRSDRI